MVTSDSKVLPKANNVNNVDRKAEPIIQADCIKTDSSAKGV
jgi:hypothetical protein